MIILCFCDVQLMWHTFRLKLWKYLLVLPITVGQRNFKRYPKYLRGFVSEIRNIEENGSQYCDNLNVTIKIIIISNISEQMIETDALGVVDVSFGKAHISSKWQLSTVSLKYIKNSSRLHVMLPRQQGRPTGFSFTKICT